MKVYLFNSALLTVGGDRLAVALLPHPPWWRWGRGALPGAGLTAEAFGLGPLVTVAWLPKERA